MDDLFFSMGSADDACVLLMQRDWSKPMYPGCWESGAGGSVLKGESFVESLKMRLEEFVAHHF